MRKVEYVPPSNDTLDKLARGVCERMAESLKDERYLNTEVIWGLAEFLKIVARIEANRLNRQQFDNSTV